MLCVQMHHAKRTVPILPLIIYQSIVDHANRTCAGRRVPTAWYAILCHSVLMLVLMLVLSGCQHAPSQPPASLSSNTSAAFQIPPLSAPLPAAETLYQRYLANPAQINPDAFSNVLDRLDTAKTQNIDCKTFDWQQLQQENFWQLAFYRLAIGCVGADSAQGQALAKYRDYVLAHILNSGDGRHAYSAFQIINLADAHEIARLKDYQLFDYYAELGAGNNALYLVLQVFDPASQQMFALYFENQRYLHALNDIPYPTIGVTDGWVRNFLPSYSKHNPSLQIPYAIYLARSGNVSEAASLLSTAVKSPSLHAKVTYADLALRQGMAFDAEQAKQWLMEAADEDYLPALALLAYLQDSGKFTKPDAEQFQEFLDYINNFGGKGQAEFMLSRHYFGLTQPSKAQRERGLHWLEQAAKRHHPDAEPFWLLYQYERLTPNAKTLQQQLQRLANQGNHEAGYLFAADVLQQEQPNAAEVDLAVQFLLAAEPSFMPEVSYLLAKAGIEGRIERTDAQIQADLNAAAERFYPKAMLLQAEQLMLQNADEAKRQARAWLYLCSKQGNHFCAYRLGTIFADGEGTAADTEIARRFFQFAIDKDFAPAMNRMALLLLQNISANHADKDHTASHDKKTQAADSKEKTAIIAQALGLFERARAQGNVAANFYLGVLYYEGEFVTPDRKKAIEYLQQAKGMPEAEQLLKQLTP